MKKQWTQIKLLIQIYNWFKSLVDRIETALGRSVGAKRMWRIRKGANGTRNGFPVILKDAWEFETQIQGPMGRHGYLDAEGNLYVFHKRHIEREGTVIVIWNQRLWVSK